MRLWQIWIDLLISDSLLVELEAAEAGKPIRKAQLLSSIRLVEIPLGLIITFNDQKLAAGVSRLIMPGENTE